MPLNKQKLPQPETESMFPAVEAWSPNHWATREVLHSAFHSPNTMQASALGLHLRGLLEMSFRSASELSPYTAPHPSVQPDSLPPLLLTAVRTFHLG